MFVPVVDQNQHPLMPTTPSRARRWISTGKATAPSGKAIASLIGGIGINGQLLVVAAPPDATELYLASLIGGTRSIQGWASGTAVDSEDTLNFSILRHVLPLIETFPLERANEAYDRMMSNQVRFRAVLTIQ